MAIPLFRPELNANAEAAANAVLRSGQIAAGPLVAEFEQALAGWTGHPHVVTTSDMSSAMTLALHILGVRAGDEVLSPAYTCLSSTAPIATLGALPRWVDVEPDTGLLDPAALAARITPSTRACIVYHAAGYPARMPEIAAICRERGLALIEDCNTALGASLGSRPVGGWGDAAIYSFYPNRQLHAAEGGAVAWREMEQAQACRRLRRFGIPLTGFRDALGELNPASDVPEIGWSAALSQLHAALGLAQLPDLPARLAATRANAQALTLGLAELPGLEVVRPQDGAAPVYWGLLVRVRKGRDTVLAALKQRGVLASKLHHRLDSYSGFGAEPVTLPGTTAFLDQVIAVPCGPWLGEQGVTDVIGAVRLALHGH
jgi:perosamine synthetase